MRRWWIVNADTGDVVVNTYFDNEARAKTVADGFEQEAGGTYVATEAPGKYPQ